MAAGEVIVDQPHRLHERVHRGRADETPALALELASQRTGLIGDRQQPGSVEFWAVAVGFKGPYKASQRALLGDKLDGALGVVDHGLDLAAVADDRGVIEQAGYVILSEAGHPGVVEAGEGAAKGIPLAQDGQPRKTGLEALEAQLLEQTAILGERETPFRVVVGPVLQGGISPPAAGDTVFADDDATGGAGASSTLTAQTLRLEPRATTPAA